MDNDEQKRLEDWKELVKKEDELKKLKKQWELDKQDAAKARKEWNKRKPISLSLWIVAIVLVFAFMIGVSSLSYIPWYCFFIITPLSIGFSLLLGRLSSFEWQKRYLTLAGSLTFVVLLSASSFVFVEKPVAPIAQTPNVSTPDPVPVPEVTLPEYEVVYVLTGARYDGGINLFVLVKPANPSSEQFKTDIQNLTNYLVQENGPKTSIDFFDSKQALEIVYQGYANLKPRSSSDEAVLDTHYVADFNGELETMGEYKNSIDYFPAAGSDHPKVGQYVDSIVYNPVPIRVSSTSQPQNVAVTTDLQAEAEKKRRKQINDQIAEWKSSGFVEEMRPEVNTVFVHPVAWLQTDYTEKQLITRLFTDYCQYSCAVPGIVHLKETYSGHEVARGIRSNSGNYNIEIK